MGSPPPWLSTRKAPGVRQLITILRVIDGIDRVDIINLLDKEKVLDKESVHFGFPFQVPGRPDARQHALGRGGAEYRSAARCLQELFDRGPVG